MKIQKKYIILLCFVCAFLQACNDFLDERPSKGSRLEIKTVEHLDALLASSVYYNENNKQVIYGSDDYEIPVELYDSNPSLFSNNILMWYLWDIDNLKNERYDNLFKNEYSKIFNANVILENINNVEGTKEKKDELKAEAHFIRACSNIQLVQTYCLPYAEKFMNEPGLPLKTETNYEQSLQRSSLRDTYDFIESDLKEALKISNVDANQIWRGNLYAVKSYMARYYLNIGDYNSALKYANEVLMQKSELVDYNTEMSFAEDLIVTNGDDQYSLKVPYSFYHQMDLVDAFNWKEYLYIRFLQCDTEWFIPSKDLLALYDKTNDLRYKYHMVEDYSYNKSIFNISSPGYFFFNTEKLPSGTTVAEMYLIKAECNARLGNIGKAMSTINILRAKRMLPGAHVILHATSIDDAILKVLAERRREMPFTVRWFDIRRFNYNETAIDDVVLKRKFYSYTSTSIDNGGEVKEYSLSERRFAVPFIDREIKLSQGELRNNIY